MFILKWFKSEKPLNLNIFNPEVEFDLIVHRIEQAKTNVIYRKNKSFWVISDAQILNDDHKADILRCNIIAYESYLNMIHSIINPHTKLKHESSLCFQTNKLKSDGVRKFIEHLSPDISNVITNFKLSYGPLKSNETIDIIVFDSKNNAIIVDIKQGWRHGTLDAKWGTLIFQALMCQYNGIMVDRLSIYDPLTCCIFVVKIPIFKPDQAEQIIDIGIKKSY